VKVAITHPYCWPEVRRGAERIIVEMARALSSRGHRVTVITSGWQPGRDHDNGFTLVRVRRIFNTPDRHERWFAGRAVPYLLLGGYDVVHSIFPRDCVAAIRTKKLRRHRTVYEEMGLPYNHWWDNMLDGPTRRRVARDVDVYGCMSQFARDVLLRESGRAGVLIPGGVRMSEFRPASERDSRPTVLFSGAMYEERKGLAVLLEALALVAESRPDVQLWLSGEGDPTPYLDAAPAAARQRTTVLPLGEPNAIAERYGRAWATVLPSTDDSFGMVLLESLACGTPIVVADHSAPPELVTKATGALCEPGNAPSLAGAIHEALVLAADSSTTERCRSFAQRYDWDDAIAPLLERIYAGSGRDE
jgi:phosphatidylinositol alpha-mannosyltransferase